MQVGKSEFGAVFESNLKGGIRHGYQKETKGNETVSESNYKDGKKHGFQKQKYSDGSTYEDSYKDGKKHGECKEIFPGIKVNIRYFYNNKLIY